MNSIKELIWDVIRVTLCGVGIGIGLNTGYRIYDECVEPKLDEKFSHEETTEE